jgi:predicted AlkP superfamily pyrophosphatase or phosphodiesterase
MAAAMKILFSQRKANMVENFATHLGFRNIHCYFRYCLLAMVFAFQNTGGFAQNPSNKVIMISLDGTPDYLVDKFLKSGVLSSNGAFARMKKMGTYAGTVLPVNVASTGPSHISIFTGASQAKTGIVGNSFRKTNQPWNTPALSAFRQPISAETIFQAAMRQGKKVMVLGGVGIDNTSEDRRTDYMHMYPVISGPSLVIDLVRTDTIVTLKNGKVYRKLKAENKSPFQPVLEISNNFKIPLTIYLTDSALNDANILRPLSQLIIDTDSDLSNGYSASIVPEQWTGMAIEANNKQYNTSFKIFKADDIAGKYRLFMTAPAEVFGYPSGFLQKLQSACGLWPGEPENRKQTTGLVSEEIWFEQIDRLAKYSRDLILAGIKEGNWDLLFGYFSTLDDVQHRYTLTNPRQLDYKAENGNRPVRYAAFIEKYFQIIDSYLLEIMNAAPKETNFVIFSDHGMIPIHTCLVLNNYFEKAGFHVSRQELTSVSSGNSAHIYINKEKINAADYAAYLARVSQSLKSLKDSVTEEPIFLVVANQEEQKKYGLYNQHYSGDLFVSCKPGYSITDRVLPGVNYLVQNSFDPVMFENQNQATRNFLLNGTMNETGRAVHGNLATVREGQSIFYAVGSAVPQKKIRKMYSLQIAATVAELLGVQPPIDAEGKSVLFK